MTTFLHPWLFFTFNGHTTHVITLVWQVTRSSNDFKLYLKPLNSFHKYLSLFPAPTPPSHCYSNQSWFYWSNQVTISTWEGSAIVVACRIVTWLVYVFCKRGLRAAVQRQSELCVHWSYYCMSCQSWHINLNKTICCAVSATTKLGITLLKRQLRTGLTKQILHNDAFLNSKYIVVIDEKAWYSQVPLQCSSV